MFENAGENHGGSPLAACPGEGCPTWEAAAGDYDYKVETKVREGCRDCGGCPPKPAGEPDDFDPAEIEELVDDIEDMIAWADAGFETDWTLYDFGIKHLVQHWRSAERDIANIQNVRMQTFLKSWFKD